MNSFCILIFAVLCSVVVWAKSESTTLSSVTSTSNLKSSAKVKRQYQFPFARTPIYSPYVGDAALDAARRNADSNAQTINQVDQKDLNGNYNYAYETTNGMKVRQTSYMVGNDRVVVGYFSYIGPDGKVYTTHYTADKYGYRATSSNSPAPENAVQPLPFVSSTPAPFVSSTPPPFVSSTPAPFISSTPFAAPTPFISSTPPFNNVPYSTNYRGPYQQFGFAPSTASPIVSSSTPFATTASPFSDTRRPHFPIYVQPSVPFQGYTYNNPRINTPYSVVSQQTPEPFFPSSTESPPNRFYESQPSNMNSRITTTLGPPQFARDFNAIPSSTFSPFEDNPPVQFRKYIPPVSVVTSTPRPFNSFSSNQPDTVIITPKPLFNQAQLPNSLSFNQNANLLPPYLSVGPLNSLSGPQNIPQDNFNFINGQPFEYNSQVRPWPQSVAPLTVTNLNYRKKRDFDKS